MATSVITPRQLQLEGDRFRPYRTIAAWYCWQAVRVLRGEMALPDSTSAGAPTARTATGASGTCVSPPAPQRAASETCVRIRSGVRQSRTSVTPRGSARTWFACRHGWLRRHSCLADLQWLQTESGESELSIRIPDGAGQHLSFAPDASSDHRKPYR